MLVKDDDGGARVPSRAHLVERLEALDERLDGRDGRLWVCDAAQGVTDRRTRAA
tara:strand:- start:638 stop:799 length:162 start_codon:yes stop_codon:yes gene_type:complete